MSQRRTKRPISLKDLRAEDGAAELTASPDMKPYHEFFVALTKGLNGEEQLDALRKIPLEKRYTWRVVSALKSAFADYDSECVRADMRTVSQEDFTKVLELIIMRPTQFCLLLKALVGEQQMRNLMGDAMKMATRGGKDVQKVPLRKHPEPAS